MMLNSFLRCLTSGDEWSAKAERLLRTAQTVAGEVLG